MLSLFLDNRRGAITVMLSFLLIAVLSINTTFLEASRYRSLERLYKEIEENAAFSALSQYDRDLFKNFGLLAMDQSMSEEKLIQYLLANINESLEVGNGADRLLEISQEDIDFEKIYDLAQSDIFKGQIDEFCAYRAPAYLLDEVLNIEDALKSFLKQLESMIPFLDVFKNVLTQAQRVVEIHIALDEYKESSQKLTETKSKYEDSVNEYNMAVAERDAYVANADEEHPIDEATLKELNSEIESKAEGVKGKIESLKKSLGGFYEKYTAFYTKYEALLGGTMEIELAALKQKAKGMSDAKQRESAMQLANSMEGAYKDSKNACGKISLFMDKVTERDILDSQEDLSEQYSILAGSGEGAGSINIVEMTNGLSLMDLVRLVISTGEAMAEVIMKVAETLGALSEVVKLLKVVGTGATYEPEYNNVVNGGLLGNLNPMQGNSYSESDRALAQEQIRKTAEVAQSLNFDTSIFESIGGMPDNQTLQNALSNTTHALDGFLTNMQSLNTSGLLVISQILNMLTAMITCVIILVEAIINLASVAAEILNGGDVMKMIYQKINAAVYANAMFSNRTTNVASDRRLNGSMFGYYSALWDTGSCFDMANGEYIIGGSTSEIQNQMTVFSLMLAIRTLCNLPAVIGNDFVMEVVKELGSTGILIPVAIVVFFAVLLTEAYLDMIFLVYTPEGVEFIKMEGYLDFTGEVEITEYFKQLRTVIEEISIRQTASQTEVEYNYTEITEEEHGVEVNADIKVGFSDQFQKKYQSLTKNTFSKAKREEENRKKLEQIEKGEIKDDGKKKIDLNKWKQDYVNGLTKANYNDHMLLLMMMLISSDKIYSRCADLVTMQMKQIKKKKGAVKEFRLEDMATYMRLETTAYYKPLLPIPVISGLNDKGFPIKRIHYSGY